MRGELIRKFETKQFTVVVEALPEDDLDLSFDEDGSVREGLESGEFIAFVAHAVVRHRTLGKLADDYLGGCIYESLDAFMDHRACGAQNREYEAQGKAGRCGSYFHDMIKQVCEDARKALCEAKGIRVRSC